MKNRLQLRYHLPKFPFTREQALEYIKDKFEKKENSLKSLVAEPLVVFYGDNINNANIILAIGRNGDGTEILKNIPYFTIDTAKIEEDIKTLQEESCEYKDTIKKILEDIKKIFADTQAIHEELDDTQKGAGLEIDGSYSIVADGNYISTSTSLKKAIIDLDKALKKEEGLRDTKDKELVAELNKTQTGAGLLSDGSYNKVEALKTNYLKDSVSLFDSEKILDKEIKTVTDNLNNNKQLVDNIRKSAGFNEKGQYVKPLKSNFLGMPETLHEADAKLDTILGNVRDAAGLEQDGTYKPCTSEMHHIYQATSLMDADIKLDKAIIDESKRAKGEEKIILDFIGKPEDGKTEDTVYGHIKANKIAIEQETARATNQENTIFTTIGNEKDTPEQTTIFGRINANKKAVADEEKRAIGRETTLQENIDKEALRAEKAEQANADNIIAEEKRATTEEGNLKQEYTTLINSEKERAMAQEKANADSVIAEKNRAVTEETAIKNYTVNNLKISSNPVLNATNVKLEGYVGPEGSGIHLDDTVQSAIHALDTATLKNKGKIETNAQSILNEKTRAETKEAELTNEDIRLNGLIETNASNIEKNKVVSSDKSLNIVSGINTDLSVNIDGNTIVKSETGQLRVASDKLVQYQGENAIKVSEVLDGVKKISLALNPGEKILSNTENGLLTTIRLVWEEREDFIKLVGKDGSTISSVPVAKFIKHGILEKVELVTDPSDQPKGTYLKFTWNTVQEGKDVKVVTYVNVTSLIDIYESGNGIEVIDKASEVGKTVKIINLVLNNAESEKDSQGVSYLVVNGQGLKIQGVNGEIAKETSRAIKAETVLQANITTTNENLTQEITNRSNGIARVEGLISVETTRAEKAEQANTKAISDEIKRSTETDTALEVDITSIKGRVEANETNIGKITGDASISGSINNLINVEKERATAVEQANAKAISDEKARAEKAEQANASNITLEKNDRTAAITDANNAIKKEETTRASEITRVSGLVDAERSRATLVENGLKDQILGVSNRTSANEQAITVINGTSEGSIFNAVEKEKERATTAEQANTELIKSESATAREAEKVNRDNITNEIDRAKEAERLIGLDIKSVTEQLNSEVTRSSDKDTEFEAKYNELLSTEVPAKIKSINAFIQNAAFGETVKASATEDLKHKSLIRKIEGTNYFFASNLAQNMTCTIETGETNLQTFITGLIKDIASLKSEIAALKQTVSNMEQKNVNAITPDTIQTSERQIKITTHKQDPSLAENAIRIGFADDAIFGNATL